MTTTPTEPIDPEANEPNQAESIRMSALQYSSFLSTKETDIKDFLKKAAKIENYIVSGKQPDENKEK